MKKKLLLITPYIPYPLNSGGNIAQFEMIDGLRDRLDITVVFPLHASQQQAFNDLQAKWPNVSFVPFHNTGLKNKVEDLVYRKLPSLFYKLINKFLIKPQAANTIDGLIFQNTTIFKSGAVGIPKAFIDHVVETISTRKPDCVQVDFFEFLPLIAYLPAGLKTIYVNHELRYVREERELSILTNKPPFYQYLYLKNKGFERAFLDQYDKVVAISHDDHAELVKTVSPDKLYISPLTVKSAQKTAGGAYQFGNKLIFLGGEEHFPNKDGVNWFITTCWQKVKAAHPSLTFSVVGKWSAATIEHYSTYDGIKFFGFVENLSDALKDGIFIVPIRIGSGIRMKILEAVNHNIPFVTTTVGVEGFKFENGIDCMIGDSPEAFSDQISKLINDLKLSEALVAHAAQTVTDLYDHDKLINTRVELYNQI